MASLRYTKVSKIIYLLQLSRFSIMQKYELLLTIPGTFDDLQNEKKLDEVVALVKDISGDAAVTKIGKNRLAYPVKQIRYGYFYTITFQTDPKQVKILEEKLRLSGDILRATISRFNTDLTSAQKNAYAADDLALTTISERKDGIQRKNNLSSIAMPTSQAPVSSPEESKVDMEGIKKKLDQILDESDIIPGV